MGPLHAHKHTQTHICNGVSLQMWTRTLRVHITILLEGYSMHKASSTIWERIQLYMANSFPIEPIRICDIFANTRAAEYCHTYVDEQNTIFFCLQLWIVTIDTDVVCLSHISHWRWVDWPLIFGKLALHLQIQEVTKEWLGQDRKRAKWQVWLSRNVVCSHVTSRYGTWCSCVFCVSNNIFAIGASWNVSLILVSGNDSYILAI